MCHYLPTGRFALLRGARRDLIHRDITKGRRVTDDDVLAEFRAADALLEGHFILSSGLRSSRYLQCARVLMDPRRGARLAEALAARLPADLREAVGELQKDEVLAEALGEHVLDHYVEAKTAEWREYSNTIHQWELDKYLDLI